MNATPALIAATATLTITDTEHEGLSDRIGVALPLGYAAALIDAEHVHQLIERKGRGGYHKTYFRIDFTEGAEESTWTGRYDLGCDAPTLAEHLVNAGRRIGSEGTAEHLAECIKAQRLGSEFYCAK